MRLLRMVTLATPKTSMSGCGRIRRMHIGSLVLLMSSAKEARGLYFEGENEPFELNHPMVTTFQLSA